MKTPDFMTYERYKKKKKKNSNNGMFIFLITFFTMLLFFSIIAKNFTPDVDVSIGDDTQTDAKSTGLGVKKFIDSRLKMIQMEDNSAGVSVNNENENSIKSEDVNNNYNQINQDNTYEENNLPAQRYNSNSENVADETIVLKRNPPKPPRPELSDPFSTSVKSKVFVGNYATIEQAKVAQEIILDSGLNITPFIKNLGNSYTLQIGSYSSRAQAENVASELQANNFPARVIQE
jgi:cell division protein FtsN